MSADPVAKAHRWAGPGCTVDALSVFTIFLLRGDTRDLPPPNLALDRRIEPPAPGDGL